MNLATLEGSAVLPKLFFGRRSSAVRREHPVAAFSSESATSPFYDDPFVVNPNAYPGAPGIHNPRVHLNQLALIPGRRQLLLLNFAAFTAALPPLSPSFYSSFMRDVCDKYLTVFADFKFVRSFFDPSVAAVYFSRPIQDPRH